MNVTSIALNTSEVRGCGFVRSVLCNQLGYLLSVAAMRKPNDKPVMDADEEAALREALGDNGLQQAAVLDKDELSTGHAAAWLLLNRAIPLIDSRGKKQDHLTDYRKSPSQLFSGFIARADTKAELHARAQAEMVGANPAKLIEAQRAEVRRKTAEVVAPLKAAFIKYVSDNAAATDEELLDVAMEALANAGRQPATEVRNAARAMLDHGAKRLNEGLWIDIDAVIYMLAERTAPTPSAAAQGTAPTGTATA